MKVVLTLKESVREGLWREDSQDVGVDLAKHSFKIADI